MKQILIILVLSQICLLTFGQKKIDVIYLNNGSVIKGKIVEQTNDKIKIETCCGSIFAFDMADVLQTNQEEDKSQKTLKENGYINLTSMGVLIGTGSNEKEAPLSILMEHNYRMNKYLAYGLLTGLETINETVLPAAINVKGMLPLSRGGAAYIGCSGGYSISLENPPGSYGIKKSTGGFLFSSEIGFIAPAAGNGSFFMAIGYRYNRLNYEREDWYSTDLVYRRYIYNRLSIRLGICFQ